MIIRLFRYEPVFDSSTSVLYLNHLILYECQGLSPDLEQLSRERGQPCFRLQPMHCNTVVANWARGSDVSNGQGGRKKKATPGFATTEPAGWSELFIKPPLIFFLICFH
uniref:Uncharacterized protein n=1 Tax=Anopheles melas TaxID=34690 RepID=A0A182TMT7_9DIPT